MKKFISLGKKVLILIMGGVLVVGVCSLVGCSEYISTNKQTSNEEPSTRFTRVTKEADAFLQREVYIDNKTGVEYFVASTVNGVGVTPILNPDGTPKINDVYLDKSNTNKDEEQAQKQSQE